MCIERNVSKNDFIQKYFNAVATSIKNLNKLKKLVKQNILIRIYNERKCFVPDIV